MPDKIQITLEIIAGEKKYPLLINEDEEEFIREATRQLRLKFMQYRQTYPKETVSDKDILAMVAIDVATSKVRLERENNIEPYTTKIQQLNYELKEYLKGQ